MTALLSPTAMAEFEATRALLQRISPHTATTALHKHLEAALQEVFRATSAACLGSGAHGASTCAAAVHALGVKYGLPLDAPVP